MIYFPARLSKNAPSCKSGGTFRTPVRPIPIRMELAPPKKAVNPNRPYARRSDAVQTELPVRSAFSAAFWGTRKFCSPSA